MVLGMVIIAKLKRRVRILRAKKGLPPLENPDDLPDPALDPDHVEVGHYMYWFRLLCSHAQVLNEKDVNELRYHQAKFAESQVR
jgi:hypothetical protein